MSDRTVVSATQAGLHGSGSSVSLQDDADTQLGLRGAGRVEIRTVAEFVQHQASLSRSEYARLSRELGLGKLGSPRSGAVDLGVAVDGATGKGLFDPADPTLVDRDCDPDLVGKSPEQFIEVLLNRGAADPVAESGWARMLQREVRVKGHGGGDRGRKKARPKGPSAVDQAAIHSVSGSLRSLSARKLEKMAFGGVL